MKINCIPQAKLEVYLHPFRSDVWIGLTDIKKEQTYKWMEGSSLGYDNFRSSFGKRDFVCKCLRMYFKQAIIYVYTYYTEI